MNYTGNIFCPDGVIRYGQVAVDNNIISEIIIKDQYANPSSDFIIPGLIDLHLHGAMCHDFCEGTKEAFRIISEYQRSKGVAGFLGATMTIDINNLKEICRAASDFSDPSFLGIYLEGPFISREKCGAQNPAFSINPDIDAFIELQKLSGNRIKAVVIAPELSGSFDFMDAVKKSGVNICIGHTCADYDISMEAIKHGASEFTHLFNAMPEFNKRNPGPCGALFDSPNVYAEIICDGFHLHPSVVRMIFNLHDEDHILLISDSTEATGMSDGIYKLGNQDIKVSNNKAVLCNDNSVIAGSVTNLYDCLLNAIKFGVPFDRAVKAATINPARCLGISDHYGSIEIGKCGVLAFISKEYYERINYK